MCAACSHVVVYGQSMILSRELIENFIQIWFQALAWKSRAVSAYFCSTVSSSSDSESDTFALSGLASEVLQAFHSFSSIWKQKQTHVEPPLIVIRDLKILKQEQLRAQDFLIAKYSSRVNQRHFWREKAVAVVILLRVFEDNFEENFELVETSYQMSEVLSFCDQERASTPTITITVLTFLVNRKSSEAFQGVYFLREYAKKLWVKSGAGSRTRPRI